MEACDRVELRRKRFVGGSVEGADGFVGEARLEEAADIVCARFLFGLASVCALRDSAPREVSVGVTCASGAGDRVDARGVTGPCGSCCETGSGKDEDFAGNGKSEWRFLLRPGNLKKVVCVETV